MVVVAVVACKRERGRSIVSFDPILIKFVSFFGVFTASGRRGKSISVRYKYMDILYM